MPRGHPLSASLVCALALSGTCLLGPAPVAAAKTISFASTAALTLPLPAAATSSHTLSRTGTAGSLPALTDSSAASSAANAAVSSAAANPETPVPVVASHTPPPGRVLSANQVLAIASKLPRMRRERAKHPGTYDGAYLKGPGRWQVSFFSRKGQEIGQVIIADGTGRVLEQWTGFQVAWAMARGYPGAFGRHVNALYIWLPLCVLFVIPFIEWRRPLSLRHLDLLVLLSFSVSLAFFNHGRIGLSVPLAYPPLLYLLARMLALTRRSAHPRPLRLLIPAPWLAFGVVFLLGFRIGLNVTDSNVIDVGYAGVIGAQRLVHGRPLYGGYPSDNEHGDTYGPVNYEAYVPFQQIFGWSGRWDDLPAGHAAAIVFDLLAVALLFLLGRRVRGPTLGVALAYAWVSYPFTLFALESNSNDTLVAVMVLAALLFASSPPARGAFAALAGLTKFAPLALVPLLATHGLRELPVARRPRAFGLFIAAFVLTAAVVSIPALTHDSLHTIYARTLLYQANRGSPFSVWGLYGGLGWAQKAVQLAAIALALALAVIPRRPGVVGLAAAAGAILIATQLGIEHWFYLYIPWFFPLVMIAVLGGRDGEGEPGSTPGLSAAAASTPAQSSQLATA